MEVKGLTLTELFELIRIVSSEFRDNIVFTYHPIAFKDDGLSYRFMLGVKDNKNAGAKLSGKGRRTKHACFHVWTRFMDLAFVKQLGIPISMRTKYARFTDSGDYFLKRKQIGETQIGSEANPIMFEDSCECNSRIRKHIKDVKIGSML